LCAEPTFAEAFQQAKARVRNMDLRFVEEADLTRQALLEIYVSVVLRTKYNELRYPLIYSTIIPLRPA
jgi:hypothetical protein